LPVKISNNFIPKIKDIENILEYIITIYLASSAIDGAREV
jgi:hypothetical protein